MSDDFSPESTDSVSMDDTIASAWAGIQGSNDEPDTPREENGRFASTQTEQIENETPPEEVQTKIQEEKPVIEGKRSPVAWQKEIADKHWSNLDPELQDEIIRREEAVDRGIAKYRESAQIGDAFTAIVKPYMPNIEASGIDAGAAINHLLGVENSLRNGDPQLKAQTVMHIMHDYGIDPQNLFGMLQNYKAPDPQIQALSRELQTMKAQRQQDEQQREQAVMAQASTELASFFKDKPYTMNQVGPLMAPFIEMGKSVQEAYDMAVYADPNLRAQELARRDTERQKEALQKANAAKKAASVNVPQRGVLPNKPTGKGSLEETIEAEARRMGMI